MKANSNIPQPAQSATDGRMHVRRNAVLHADCLACAENSTLFSCAFALVFSAARMLMAIVAVLLLMLLPLAARAFAQRATPHADSVVAQPVIDMFSKPSLDSDVISQAIYGANIVTLAHQGEWAQIRTADEYTGWVEAKNLRKLPAAGYPAADRLVQITALGANVYREPDLTKHAPVLRLPWEALLEAIPDAPGNTERWLAVRLADGQTAWVQHGDATTAPRTLGIDETLQLARRFLGITYTWGGVSSFGFDCSGFTQMLVRQRGTLMPAMPTCRPAGRALKPWPSVKTCNPAICSSSVPALKRSLIPACTLARVNSFTIPCTSIPACRSANSMIPTGATCWWPCGE